ncbi:MAG: hypothetical protein C4320_02705, partial [Armatimonadota bacterium]
DRRQFGRPIAEFGLIQEKFAMAAAKFFAIESAIYRTGALVDEGFAVFGGSTDGNRKAAEEYAIECSAIKVMATEAESEIVDEMLQVYGGYGFTEEFPIARHYRDARVSRIYEGTNEINRVFLADRLMKKILSGALELSNAAGDEFGEAALVGVRQSVEEGGKLDQVRLAALSDLLMVAYVAQSSRMRARRIGGAATDLHRLAESWLRGRMRAAQARFSRMSETGKGWAEPIASVADLVHDGKGPLDFK